MLIGGIFRLHYLMAEPAAEGVRFGKKEGVITEETHEGKEKEAAYRQVAEDTAVFRKVEV